LFISLKHCLYGKHYFLSIRTKQILNVFSLINNSNIPEKHFSLYKKQSPRYLLSFYIFSSLMMRQLRFRFIHLAILLISIFFYTKMRKVSKIQNFLTEQSKSLFNNQNELNDYREQFRKVREIF